MSFMFWRVFLVCCGVEQTAACSCLTSESRLSTLIYLLCLLKLWRALKNGLFFLAVAPDTTGTKLNQMSSSQSWRKTYPRTGCVSVSRIKRYKHLNATLKWKESVLPLYLCRDGLALGFFLKGPH